MAHPSIPKIQKLMTFAVLCSVGLSLSACNVFDRVMNIGSQPRLDEIHNPTKQPGYRPVDLPMPDTHHVAYQSNSLWRPGSKAFFKDQRASQVGDILTVLISMNNSASTSNESKRERDNSEDSKITKLFRDESILKKLTDSTTGGPSGAFERKHKMDGKGSIDRTESITLRLAAIITQVLPNGNFVIQGRQQVRVNYDMTELMITGVVRPEDIDRKNETGIEKVAEARVSYGGRGQIMDFQQPPYGAQLFDIIMPF